MWKESMWISWLKFIQKSWKVEFSNTQKCRVAWDQDEANNLFLVDRIEDNSLSITHTHTHTNKYIYLYTHTHTYIPPSILTNQLCNNQSPPFKNCIILRNVFIVFLFYFWVYMIKEFVSWSHRRLN